MTLTDEQKMACDSARDFAEKRLKPLARQFDEEEKIPRAIYDEAAGLGFFGMLIPEAYGGLALDPVAYAMVIEELSKACAAFSVCVSVHNSLFSQAVLGFGTEEQKAKYLPKLASGEWIGAYSLSEPASGSDAGSVSVPAVLQGAHYVVDGVKSWVSSAEFADLFLLFCSTDKTKGSRGVSCLIVPKDTPGLGFGNKEKKLGIRGSDTRELHFKAAKVPAENLLGARNEGFKIAMAALEKGRVGVAAQAVGIAQAALDEALNYARQRRQFGKALSEFQATQFKLADMAVRVKAARLLTHDAARALVDGRAGGADASIAKLFASETANKVAYDALQIHGGNGYIREFPVERYFRDARITEIYEGTSEIQRLVIARRLLKG